MTDGDDVQSADDYRQSSFRESLLEHVFIAELLQEAWFGRRQVVEVLRAEVDAFGYDLVAECNGVTRHIQLKASRLGGRAARQTINMRLSDKLSGCVVWIQFDQGADHRATLTYLFYGGAPGEPLPHPGETLGINPYSKAVRPNTRVIRRGQFEPVPTTSLLLDKLFGVGNRASG